MQHRFYLKTAKQQQVIQWQIIGAAILLNIILAGLFFSLNLAFMALIIVAISLSIIAPFIDVPAGVKSGSLRYYSPLLIGEKVKNDILTLHSGSLFDYYFVLTKGTCRTERKKQVFRAYLQGLLNLIEQYDTLDPSGIKIKATSYIINARTAEKIGLRKVKVDFIQSLILVYNYFNLLLTLSFMHAKLSSPKLSKMSSFEGDLVDLIDKKEYLLALKNRL